MSSYSPPGRPSPAAPSYATIGSRVGAYLLDSVFAGLAVGGGIVLTAIIAFSVATASLEAGVVIAIVGYVLAGLGYAIWVWRMTAVKGYSPGKKMLGLRLVDADTLQPIGWLRVLLRGLVLGLIGSLTFGIGYLVVAVVANGHPRRQGWHDLAVGSVVVPESALRAGPTWRPAPAEGAPPVELPGARPGAPVSGAPAPIGPPSPAAALRSVASARPEPPPMPTTAPTAPAAPPMPAAPPAPAVTAPSVDVPAAAAPPVGAPPTGSMVAPPPGVVAASPSVAPATPEPAVDTPAAPSPFDTAIHAGAQVDDSTRMAAHRERPTVTWELSPEFGQAKVLGTVLLLGRDPDASLRDGAAVWAIDDPQRTVSKTHGAAGVDDDGPWIEDWDSTNGIVVRRGDTETDLAPRTRTPLEDGDTVLLGDFTLHVRRHG